MKQLLITIAALVLVGCGPKHPDTSIHEAVYNGNVEAVKQHIAAGTDLNLELEKEYGGKGQTPLHLAVRSRNKDVVMLIIENGADINHKIKYNSELYGNTPLDSVSFFNNNDMYEMLKKLGGKHGTIHGASAGGDIRAVQTFLEVDGADINEKEELMGFSSLNMASLNGHDKIVKLLIDKKADINSKTDKGKNSLHLASIEGHFEVVKLLVFNDIDINVIFDSYTPLDAAIINKREEIAKFLKNNGAKTSAELKSVIKYNELESNVPELGLKKDKSKFYYDMAAIKGNGANWPVTKNSRVLRKNYSDLNDAQFIDKLFSMMEKSEGKIHAFVLVHKDRTQKEINYATAKALNHPYEKSASSTGQQVYTTSEYLFEAESFSKLIPKKFNLPSSTKHVAKTAEELKAEGK